MEATRTRVLRCVALAAVVGMMLYVGSSYLAARAAEEAGGAATPRTVPAGSAPADRVVRVSARIRGVITPKNLPRGEAPSAGSSESRSGNGTELLVAETDAPFLRGDVRLASNTPTEDFGLTRAFDRVVRDPRAAEVRLAAPTSADYATKIDDPAIRVYLPRDNFADTDPGTVTASMSGLDVDALRSVAGARMQLITANSERGRVLAETRLSWLYEYLQTEGAGSAFFVPGDKGIFAVQGLSYGSNWLVLGYGFRWELAGGWTAYTHYDAQANMQQMFHIGSAGFGYAW